MKIYFAASPSPWHFGVLERTNVEGILCSFAALNSQRQMQELEKTIQRMKRRSIQNAKNKQRKVT